MTVDQQIDAAVCPDLQQLPPLQQNICQYLCCKGIPFLHQTHPAVYTVAEALAIRPMLADVPHCKTLCCRPVRRGAGQLFLVVIQEHKRADLRVIGHDMGTTKLELADENTLFDLLGVRPGAVSPLCLVRPQTAGLNLLLDADLKSQPHVCFHPGVNTASVILRQADWQRFLDSRPNKIITMPM